MKKKKKAKKSSDESQWDEAVRVYAEAKAKAAAKGIDVGMGAGPSLASAHASLPPKVAAVKPTKKNNGEEFNNYNMKKKSMYFYISNK